MAAIPAASVSGARFWLVSPCAGSAVAAGAVVSALAGVSAGRVAAAAGSSAGVIAVSAGALSAAAGCAVASIFGGALSPLIIVLTNG